MSFPKVGSLGLGPDSDNTWFSLISKLCDYLVVGQSSLHQNVVKPFKKQSRLVICVTFGFTLRQVTSHPKPVHKNVFAIEH